MELSVSTPSNCGTTIEMNGLSDSIYTPSVTEFPEPPYTKANKRLSPDSIPWPGSTFMIRYTATDEMITLLDGNILLDRPGGKGHIYWSCLETKGYLTFKNPISGRYLGHNQTGTLICSAERPARGEFLFPRANLDGGYMLMMECGGYLQFVEVNAEKKAALQIRSERAASFEFIKVEG